MLAPKSRDTAQRLYPVRLRRVLRAIVDAVEHPPEHERIIEAPEFLLPPPALGGMLIEPASEPEPERQPGIDMPLKTAPLSRIAGQRSICAL